MPVGAGPVRRVLLWLTLALACADRVELAVLPGCSAAEFATSAACTLSAHAQTLSLRGSSVAALRVQPGSSGASERSLSLHVKFAGESGDTDAVLVPLSEFEAHVAERREAEAGGEAAAVRSPLFATDASAHPLAISFAALSSAVASDEDGSWPALRLRKAATYVSLRAPLDRIDVVGGREEQVLLLRGGKRDAALSIAAVYAPLPGAGTVVPHGRVLQAPAYTPLSLNTPLTSSVGFNSYSYFSYDARRPILSPLNILVSGNGLGDADLYVTIDGSVPSQSNFQYSSTGFFVLEQVTVGPASVPSPSSYCTTGVTCPIRIAVYGFTAVTFTITITSGLVPTAVPITSGVPIVDGLPFGGGTDYYSLRSLAPATGGAFAFSLTALAGSASLYVSTSRGSITTPNASAYCWLAPFDPSQQYVQVTAADVTGCYCGGPTPQCTYYIGVSSPNATVYVLTGIEEGTSSVLTDGTPTSGVVPQGQTDLYTLLVQPLPPSIAARVGRMVEIATFPLYGDSDLYVTLDGRAPGPTSYDYASESSEGVDYVAMRGSDAKVAASACANWTVTCTIRVGVFGFSSAGYLLYPETGLRPTALVSGVPLEATVDPGYYVFFSFTTYTPTEAVVITAEASSGYTAMYVGAQYNNATLYPTADVNSNIWTSTTLSANVVVIEPSDPKACKLTPCTYTIGVRGAGIRGAQGATFEIVARVRSSAPSSLAPGIPVVDVVELRDYNRYRAYLNRSLGFMEVTVSPINGDPDLYLALDNRTVSTSSWQYSAASPSGADDDILVSATDAQVRLSCAPAPAPCIANIAVYGYSRSAYSITVSNGLRLLGDGQTTSGIVAGATYSYFALDVWARLPITLTVTPSSGDPDVYASMINPRPTSANYNWSAAGDSLEVIVIDPSDPGATACFNVPPCRLYIGVYGFGLPSSRVRFVITGSTSTTVALRVGIPTPVTIAPASFSYFIFSAPPEALTYGLEFVATVTTPGSDVTLFVGNTPDPSQGPGGLPLFPIKVCLDPSCTNFNVNYATWDSGDSSERGEVTIAPGDPSLTAPAYYVVGVYSDSGASVLVTGALGNTIKALTPGVPFQDAVSRGAYSYFSLALSTYGADIAVQVTPLTGDPDLYVSVHDANRNPTVGNADRSASSAGIDRVTFSWPELTECTAALDPVQCAAGSACICYIYIGVYGYSNATFSVLGDVIPNGTASSLLIDGLPQQNSQAVGSWAFFYVDLALRLRTTYSFAVRTTSGDPDLYVTTDGMGPPSVIPRHWQYSSTHFAGDETVDVRPGDATYNSTVRAWAGVLCYSGNCSYTITFATAGSVTELAEGRPAIGLLPPSGYGYYSYLWNNPRSGTVSFTATAMAGDPDLYMSVWPPTAPSFRPSVGFYTWKAEAFGSDTITVAPSDPRACARACNLIIAVYCATTTGNCRHSISVTNSGSGTGGLVTLTDGTPQASSVVAGSYTYFVFTAPSSNRPLTFRVTPTASGDAQLVVTNLYTPGVTPVTALPVNRLGRFVWSSARGNGEGATGTGLVSIPTTDANRLYNMTTYVVGVWGVTSGPSPTPGPSPPSVSFNIVASSSDIPTVLLPGIPSTANYVSTGNNAHFAVDVQDLTQDLFIAVTLNDGSATIAVTGRDAGPWPMCTSPTSCTSPSGAATWTSTSNILRIQAPAGSSVGPCIGPYATGPCTGSGPNSDWRVGRYYIAVYGTSGADFSITAFTNAAYVTLLEGRPQLGAASAALGAAPEVFVYRTSPDLRLPDVRINVAADAWPLAFFVNSCSDSACTPIDQVPGPSNYEYAGSVDSSSALDTFLTKFMQGVYCAATAGHQCIYFIGVAPAAGPGCPTDPSGATCPPVTFTITAASQSGKYPNIIQQSSFTGKVYSMTGNTEPGTSALYELYMNATSPPVDVAVDVQACSAGYVNLYVCNPSPTNSAVPCTDPFNPNPSNPGGSTGGVSTSPLGEARWVERGVSTSNYFFAVAADSVPLSSGNWLYQVLLSSGRAFYLSAPATPVSAAPLDAVTLNVTWPAAVVIDETGAPVGPAKGVTYYVYPAQGGFVAPGNPYGVISTTACGVFVWSGTEGAGAGVQPVATQRDVLWAEVAGLTSGAAYEFAVIAECDRACWTASAPKQDVCSGAPGYVTQRVVYGIAAATAGNPDAPASITNLSAAGIAGISVGLLALVGAGAAVWAYRRSHAFDRSYQYDALDLGSSGGGGGGGVGFSPPVVRSSGLASMFFPAPSSGRAAKAGLADSEYNSLDDRVDAYM